MKLKFQWLLVALFTASTVFISCNHFNKNAEKQTDTVTQWIDKGDSIYKAREYMVAHNFRHPFEITSKYKITDSPTVIRPQSQFHIPDFEKNLYELITPLGKKYASQLDNGTSFCINSGSNFIFHPGITNYMELTGEGYFKINGDATTIRVNNTIKVLADTGTELNITAYKDYNKNDSPCIALIKGKARVMRGVHEIVLNKPGTFIVYNPNRKTFTKKTIDINDVLAWQHDVFDYGDIDYYSLLQRICRWYNLQLVCPKLETYYLSFDGDFSEPAQQIIDRINLIAFDIICRIEGKKLIVQLRK